MNLKPKRTGGGRVAPNSSEWCLAPEQVHRIAQRTAPGELDGVQHAIGLEQRSDFQAVVEPKAPRDAVGHVQLGGHREVVADRIAHGP